MGKTYRSYDEDHIDTKNKKTKRNLYRAKSYNDSIETNYIKGTSSIEDDEYTIEQIKIENKLDELPEKLELAISHLVLLIVIEMIIHFVLDMKLMQISLGVGLLVLMHYITSLLIIARKRKDE